MEIILQSLLAGAGTLLGALVSLGNYPAGSRAFGLLLAGAAGIMTSVIIFDLLPGSMALGSLTDCLTGFVCGFMVIIVSDISINLNNNSPGAGQPFLNTGYLIALGIALHDLPEGIAIAAGHSAPGTLGPLIALAIGLHNIPEGMATAIPLRAGGASIKKILGLNGAVSIITPAGTLLGLLIIHVSPGLISALLAFAAGAMTYIVACKLIPLAHRHGKPVLFAGLVPGLLFMFFLKLFFE